jgi:hypothetical protein
VGDLWAPGNPELQGGVANAHIHPYSREASGMNINFSPGYYLIDGT